jgi:hypothetical protein
MRNRFAKIALATVMLIGGGSLAACDNDADVANKNLSTDADNFKVYRRVVFYNAILNKYVMIIEGWCSVDFSDPNKQSTICRVGGTEDKPLVMRNGMSKSDNVFCFYTQLQPNGVSANHYKIVLKPEAVIPDFEVR